MSWESNDRIVVHQARQHRNAPRHVITTFPKAIVQQALYTVDDDRRAFAVEGVAYSTHHGNRLTVDVDEHWGRVAQSVPPIRVRTPCRRIEDESDAALSGGL